MMSDGQGIQWKRDDPRPCTAPPATITTRPRPFAAGVATLLSDGQRVPHPLMRVLLGSEAARAATPR